MQQNHNSNRRKTGSLAEEYAKNILEKNGYSLLCRNYTCKGGEADLIVTKDKYICFVEVKMRAILSENSASEAVDCKKISRIKLCIENFFREYSDNKYITSLIPRIDIFEVYTYNGTVTKYNHIPAIT